MPVTPTFLNKLKLQKCFEKLHVGDLYVFRVAYSERLASLGFTTAQREKIAESWVEKTRYKSFNNLKSYCRYVANKDIETLNEILLSELKNLIIHADDHTFLQFCKEQSHRKIKQHGSEKYFFQLFVQYFKGLKRRALTHAQALSLSDEDKDKIDEPYNSLIFASYRSSLLWKQGMVPIVLGVLMVGLTGIALVYELLLAGKENKSIYQSHTPMAAFFFTTAILITKWSIDEHRREMTTIPEGSVSVFDEENMELLFGEACAILYNAKRSQPTYGRNQLKEIFPSIKSSELEPVSLETDNQVSSSSQPKQKIKTKGQANPTLSKKLIKIENTPPSNAELKRVLPDGTKVQTKSNGDIVVMKEGKNTSVYMKLADSRFFFFNRGQLNELYSTSDFSKRQHEIDLLYKKIKDKRRINPPEEALTKKFKAFYGLHGKVRLGGQDNRLGTELREPTAGEKEAGITTAIHMPAKIVNHAMYKRS